VPARKSKGSKPEEKKHLKSRPGIPTASRAALSLSLSLSLSLALSLSLSLFLSHLLFRFLFLRLPAKFILNDG
jgi:hypothetical protein